MLGGKKAITHIGNLDSGMSFQCVGCDDGLIFASKVIFHHAMLNNPDEAYNLYDCTCMRDLEQST